MIVCPRCSKENQDHYKFCLGCGAELPRDAEQPKSFSAATPPGGAPAVGAPPPPVSPPQFGGAAASPAPRPAGPPPAFGAPPPGPPLAPPGPPLAPPGPPMAPPGPPPAFGAPPSPPLAGPPMAPPAPPMASPAPPLAGSPAPGPLAGPPVPSPPLPPPPSVSRPSGPPSAPVVGPPPSGGFGGPSPVPAPPVAPSNGAPGAVAGNVVCPQCGTSNNRNFKFCGSCGHALANLGAPPPSPAVAPSSGAGRATLILIRPDGTEGDAIPVDAQTVLGRATMPQFAGDSYLSPRHASFFFGPSGVGIRDENSLNGIYYRIEREVPTELEDGTIFRIGQEIIRLEHIAPPKRDADGVEPMGSPREGLVARICLVTGRETHGNCYAIPAEGLHLGRERGDILFPDDGYVSGLHARIHSDGGKIFLTDVGSSNGTFIRIKGERTVPSGTMLLMGQQLFRLEY